MRNEKETAASRVSRLLEYMERVGEIRLGEIAALLGVSAVTAGHDAAALRACPWVTFGREFVCETERDRKLRLSPALTLCVLSVERSRIRTMRFFPATGEITRSSYVLCDAISEEEALSATLAQVLGVLRTDAETSPLIGVMICGDVTLPAEISVGLASVPIEERDTLTVEGLAREYGEESVLYLRGGELPTMVYVERGIPLANVRPSVALKQEWPTEMGARVRAMVKHTSELLSVLSADRLVVEADGGAQALTDALLREAEAHGVVLPTVESVAPLSLAEREMLSHLRYRLAEMILREYKEKNS